MVTEKLFAFFARAYFRGFRAEDTEDAKFLQTEFLKFIYKSLNVAFEEFSSKVHQESESQMGKFQVSQYPLLMYASKGFNRLQLDEHDPSHDKIRPKALIKSLPAKVNRNGLLPFN